MTLFAESEARIFGEILFNIANDTNIRRSSPGSKTRAIAEALSSKLGQMYQKFDVNIALSFLDGATGKYLDFIGDMMGVSRLGETAGSSTSSEQNIRFYTDLGTFGSINGGGSINIPAGTIISTGKDGTGIRYQVPYTVILPASSTVVFVGVESLSPGSFNNVGAQQLIYHNFQNYTQALLDTLKVTNDAEISSGQDIESDVNFRFRIANQVVAAEKANLTAIRLSALSVPGVADVILLPFNKGIGTLDLLIKATVPLVPVGLLAAVQDAISNVSAQGIIVTAKPPIQTGFSLLGTLTTRTKLSPTDQSSLISAVTDNITNFVNSLDIGQDLIVNQMVQKVLDTSDQIKNVGVANKPFDQMFIYKTSKLQDNRVRNTLLLDYTPDADERIVIETQFAGATPVLFRVV